MLNRFYQWLLTFKNQDDLREEMLDTFEEGRREARARGMFAYLRFVFREIVGVLGLSRAPARRRAWVTVTGLTLAGFLAGVAVNNLGPASYTSEAALVITPPTVSFGPPDEIPLEAAWLQGVVLPRVLSRTTLINIINQFGLYQRLRSVTPIEDVIEHMRRSIRIESTRNGIEVGFTLSDWTLLKPRSLFSYDTFNVNLPPATRSPRAEQRLMAQRVTQDLVARIVDEAIRQRINQVDWTPVYLEERANKVGREWEKLTAQLQALAANDPRTERLTLDRDLARKDYEGLRQRLAEARVMQDIRANAKGSRLEMLDPASLPILPDSPQSVATMLGMGAGFGVGWFLVLYRNLRRIPEKPLAPQVA